MTTHNISDLAPLFWFLRLRWYYLFLCICWWIFLWVHLFGYIPLDDWIIDVLTTISFGYLMIGNIAYLVIKDEHSNQEVLKFKTSVVLWVFFLRVIITVFIFMGMSIGSFIMSAIYGGSYLVFFLNFSLFVAMLFGWIGLNTVFKKTMTIPSKISYLFDSSLIP